MGTADVLYLRRDASGDGSRGLAVAPDEGDLAAGGRRARARHEGRGRSALPLPAAGARSAAGEHTPEVLQGVAPLLRELILHILSIRTLLPDTPSHVRIAGFLIDLLLAARPLDLALPLPRDRRALAFAERLQEAPSERDPASPNSPEAPGAEPPCGRCNGCSPPGDRADPRSLAAEGAPASRSRAALQWRAGRGNRCRLRLRQPERLHHRVQAPVRDDAGTLPGMLKRRDSSRALASRRAPSSSVASRLGKQRRIRLVTGSSS